MNHDNNIIKVAFFLRSAHGGGAERVSIALANALSARGYAVDLVFVQAVGSFLSDIHADVQVVDLKAKQAILSVWGLRQYLKQHQPDVLIAVTNYINVMAILATKLPLPKKPQIIVTEHGTLGAVIADLKGRAKIVPQLMKMCYPSARHIVAVSQGVADDLATQLQLPRDHIRVIYNPLDFAKIHQLQHILPSHPWVKDDIPIVLGVGRLIDVKNFPLLIKAFFAVREKIACRLVILGQGNQQDALQTLIAQSPFAQDVALLGFCDNPFAWMKAARVFVLSSKTEGLPTVLIEALACGTQVISTDCPHGPREILQHGAWGSLVENGNIAELSDTLYQVLNGNIHLTVNEAELQQRFGLESICRQYEQLIGDCVSRQ